MSRRTEPMAPPLDLWWAYRLRWKRRQLLWQAIRARHQLRPLQDRTTGIRPGEVLCFATIRNESLRLPGFLAHYRKLGVDHFLIVLHDSSDESAALLADQDDVSVWSAHGSYRDAHFGMDWLGWLQARHGHGHWCVTVDADELLIYPHWPDHDLHSLTDWLTRQGRVAMGAMMLDLYPKGPIGQPVPPGTDPVSALEWFDPGPYRCVVQYPKQNRWLTGGARERVFFADRPERGPTLNKLPLVLWDRRYAYMVSTHSMLPRRLNRAYDGPGDPRLSGILLHTKFLSDCRDRACEEKGRGEHFGEAHQYDSYYDAVMAGPEMWHPGSQRLDDWRQLVDLGLMSAGDWHPQMPAMAERT